MRHRDLDFGPLSRRSGVRDRLRAIGASPLLTFSVFIVGLLPVVFTGVLVFVIAGGHADESFTFVVVPVMMIAIGCFVLSSLWSTAGETGSLDRFARANRLFSVSGTLAPEYAGSLFALRQASVDRSVRTRGRDFVEVGDRFEVLRATPSATRERALFLRARLPGGSARDPRLGAQVPPDVADRLRRFAGEQHVVELTADELTVFGAVPLGTDDPDRVREAFDLIDTLAAENAAGVASELDTTATVTPRGRGPLRVVLGTIAMLVVVSLGFALVMSAVDGLTRGHHVPAVLVVLALVAVIGIAVRLVVQRLLTPTQRGSRTPPAS